jgi:hypothetical protein
VPAPAPTDPDLVRAELELRLAWARDHGAAYDAAVWQLLLGRAEDGLEALRSHVAAADAEWGRAHAPPPEWAVVAGDWERAKKAARVALGEPTERLVPGYRPYVRALYALTAGLTEDAAAHVRELREYVEGRTRLPSGHPADIADVAAGLLETSPASVTRGTNALLDWHVRRSRARSDVFNSARAFVCLEAIVVLLLAHRLGLAVEVAPEHRRASLPLLVTYLREWRGEPLAAALKLALETDLVAGPWLRLNGLKLPDPSPRPPSGRRSAPARPRRLTATVDAEIVRESLRERVRNRQGSAWQLASWALMLGDPNAGRAQLAEEAAAAQRRWQESVPLQGSLVGLLRRPAAVPNHNYLREHFALALVLGDDAGLRRTMELLRAWDETAALGSPYGHFSGYLDLIRHLLDRAHARPTRAAAEEVGGPLPSMRVVCVALAEGDTALLGRGLNGMLAEHARALERTTSPDPPVCAPAVHVAAAADRLRMPFAVAPELRRHEVPIVVSVRGRTVGRLACDLLGSALWRAGETA